MSSIIILEFLLTKFQFCYFENTIPPIRNFRSDTQYIFPHCIYEIISHFLVRFVALRNATMAIGRSRRPRGPTYARGANRSQFEDPELAVNARRLATRRAHPAFKFFTSLIPEAESFNLESFVPATTGGLEEHMLPPQMSG
jgi:hypothetical protein